MCSLGVRIFGLRYLGVRNFGSTVFWLAGYLGSTHLDHRISVSLCGCLLRVVWFFGFFLGSHVMLVAVSAPLMMPLRDSDIPMNVPFTCSNKQALNPGSGMRGRLGWCGVRWLFQGCCAGLRLKHGTAAAWRAGTLRKGS